MRGRCSTIRRADRVVIPPRGLAGGAQGRASRFLLHPDSPDEKVLPASATVPLGAGDTFRIETTGGGGYGNPGERDPAAVAEDRREGRVTE